MTVVDITTKRARANRQHAVSRILKAETALRAAINLVEAAHADDPQPDDNALLEYVAEAISALEVPCRILRLGS